MIKSIMLTFTIYLRISWAWYLSSTADLQLTPSPIIRKSTNVKRKNRTSPPICATIRHIFRTGCNPVLGFLVLALKVENRIYHNNQHYVNNILILESLISKQITWTCYLCAAHQIMIPEVGFRDKICFCKLAIAVVILQ